MILPGQIYRDLTARMERRLLRVWDVASDHAILRRIGDSGAQMGQPVRVSKERLADPQLYEVQR